MPNALNKPMIAVLGDVTSRQSAWQNVEDISQDAVCLYEVSVVAWPLTVRLQGSAGGRSKPSQLPIGDSLQLSWYVACWNGGGRFGAVRDFDRTTQRIRQHQMRHSVWLCFRLLVHAV
jgi:hypothetical protein